MHYHKISYLLLILCNYILIVIGVEYIDTFANIKIAYEQAFKIKKLESRISGEKAQWIPTRYDITLSMSELKTFSVDDDIFYNKLPDIKFMGIVKINLLPNIGSTYIWFKTYNLQVAFVDLSIVNEHNDVTRVLINAVNLNDTEYYKIELIDVVQPQANYVLKINYYASYADLVFRKSKPDAKSDNYWFEVYNPFATFIGGTFFPTIGEPYVTSEFYLNIKYHDADERATMLWSKDSQLKVKPHSIGFLFQHKSSYNENNNFENIFIFDANWIAEEVPPVVTATATHMLLKWFANFFHVNYPLRFIYIMASPDYDTDTYGGFGQIIVKIDALTKVVNYENEYALYLAIARQMAYQWFGHIVSYTFVYDEWIFKSISTYLAYHAIDDLWPHLYAFDELDLELQNNMHMLSLNYRNLLFIVENNIDKAALIHYELYKKGIVIIKFFIDQVVPYNFSIKQYINKTITDEEILKQMNTGVDGNPISTGNLYTEMNLQIGYPVLIVNKMLSGQDDPYIKIEQKTFTYVKEHHFLRPLADNWEIIFNFKTVSVSKSHSRTSTVEFTSNTHTQSLSNDTNYYLIFFKSNSYFRVNYDIENWQALQKCLMEDHHQIHVHTRLILVDDALHLARGSYLSYDLALDLIKYMKKEREYVVWKCAIKEFYYIDSLIEDYAAKENFKIFMRDLIGPIFIEIEEDRDELKFDKNHPYYRLSHLIHEFACYIDHEMCMSNKDSFFIEWRHSVAYQIAEQPLQMLQNIGYDLSILCFMGIKFDSKRSGHWNYMWNIVVGGTATLDKYIMLTYVKALGKYSSNHFDIMEFIKLMFFDHAIIRKYFLYEAFDALFSNTMFRDLGFDALRRFDEMNKTQIEVHIYKKVVRLAIEKIRTEQQYNFMLTHLNVKSVNEIKDDYLVHSDFRRNINWIQLHSFDVGEWFLQNTNIQSYAEQQSEIQLTNDERMEKPYTESLIDSRAAADTPHYLTIDNILTDAISYLSINSTIHTNTEKPSL